MVAERGVELHPGIQQRLVRLFETSGKVFRLVPAINVVSQHDYETESDNLAVSLHFLGHHELWHLAGPGISDHRKTN